jgi:hypothetical protein
MRDAGKVRVRAAECILNHANKAIEIEDIEVRPANWSLPSLSFRPLHPVLRFASVTQWADSLMPQTRRTYALCGSA